ncbi:MAG: DUF4167 domain-containing protein [Caulobacteraceae bacterium]
MKRQRGRNRGSGGGSSGGNGGGGGKPTHNVNRAFDSNGPDNVKIRGHAQHVYEKYQQLARDATLSGDRVLAENYLQHAEHYFRLIRSIQPQRPASEIVGRDVFASGYDIDFEDESGGQEITGSDEGEAPQAEGESQQGGGYGERQERFEPRPESRQDQQRFDNRNEPRRDDRPERNDRQDRNDRPERNDRQEGRYENRDNRQEPRGEPRQDQPRQDQPRQDQPRQEQPRSDQQRFEPRGARRDERPRFEGRERGPREDRFEPRGDAPRDPMPVVEPRATPLTVEPAEVAETSQVLRSQDGGVSHAPAFLQGPAAVPSAEEGEVRRPRGRPRRKPAAESATPAEAEEV